MRSDKPGICPDCGDTHYRTESCAPASTPKPTAADHYSRSDGSNRWPDAEIRRKAFEAAAEKYKPLVEAGDVECRQCVLTEDCKGIERHCAGCQRKIVARYFKAIRVLAKEQPDEDEDKSPRPLGEREVQPRMLGDLDPADGSW